MFLTIKLCTYAKLKEQIIYIKMDLALNNLQRLIWHKTQQTKPNQTNQTLLTYIIPTSSYLSLDEISIFLKHLLHVHIHNHSPPPHIYIYIYIYINKSHMHKEFKRFFTIDLLASTYLPNYSATNKMWYNLNFCLNSEFYF